MQYTDHYNLNLPEGTDIVNPLIQDNPNYRAIDTALYDNKLRVIGTASEITAGTVHAITRADTDIPVFRFVATSDYNTGDSFTVDGVTVTATKADGTALKNKAYVINSSVLAILDGTKLTLVNGEGVIDAEDIKLSDGTTTVEDAVTYATATTRIGMFGARPLMRKVYEVSNINVPNGTDVDVASFYIDESNIFSLSCIIGQTGTSAISNGSTCRVFVKNDKITVNQNQTGSLTAATIRVVVEWLA